MNSSILSISSLGADAPIAHAGRTLTLAGKSRNERTGKVWGKIWDSHSIGVKMRAVIDRPRAITQYSWAFQHEAETRRPAIFRRVYSFAHIGGASDKHQWYWFFVIRPQNC